MLAGRKPCQRWVALALLAGRGAAAVEELVSIHDVQAYRRTVARTVGVCSALLGCSGIGRLAAQPSLRESHLDKRSSPRCGRLLIAGSCWKKPQRGFEEREPSASCCLLCAVAVQSVTQHGNADLPVATSSGVRFGGVWTVHGWHSTLGPFGVLWVDASERQLPG